MRNEERECVGQIQIPLPKPPCPYAMNNYLNSLFVLLARRTRVGIQSARAIPIGGCPDTDFRLWLNTEEESLGREWQQQGHSTETHLSSGTQEGAKVR